MNLLDLITGPSNFEDRFLPFAPGGAPAAPPMQNIPLPRPRPPEAGPAAPPIHEDPGEQSGLGMTQRPSSFNGDMLAKVLASLGAGLSNVKNSPFVGEAIAPPAGAALQGGAKFDADAHARRLHELDRKLKLKQIEQLGSYRDESLDLKAADVDTRARVAATREAVVPSTIDRNLRTGDAATRTAATREAVVPSVIRKNDAAADRDEARTRGDTDPSLRLKRADQATDLWYRPRINQLRDERTRVLAMPGTPAERQARMADIDRRLQELDKEYFEQKRSNRKAHGLNDDGTDARPAPAPRPRAGAPVAPPAPVTAAPAAPAVPARPGEIAMKGSGTREAPYQPTTSEEYAEMPSGTYYVHPDGRVRQKK